MKQLVLGAGGFLGSALVSDAVRRGERVVAVSRRAPATSSPGVEAVACDLHALDQAELEALVAGAATVHHLAWSSLPAEAEADPVRDHADNVGFMLRLLAAVRRTGVRLVFVSSGGTVYGPSFGAPLQEDRPLRPVSAYGAAKAAAEVYAGLFREAYSCDVRIARLANPFGEGQRPERMQGALSRFALLALAGRPVEIWGDGGVVRDYLHVSDAVAGLRAVADAPASPVGAAPPPVFNISSGRGTSLNGLVAILGRALGAPLDVRYRPGRTIDVPSNVLSNARAAERLGWSPALTLEEGVDRLLRDFRAR